MRTAAAVLLALSIPTLTGGCAAMAVAGAVGGVAFVGKDRTLGEGVDETTAGAQVRTRLLAADFGVYSQIAIEVAQGRVLLAGAVPTELHRTEADRIARGVPAVRVVENNLEVGPRPDVWRTSWDQWISAEIRTRLLADDDIKGLNFVVETHRGVVYMLGLARSEAELQKAAEIARRINGVERVISYVEVRVPNADYAEGHGRLKPEIDAALAEDEGMAPHQRFEARYPDEEDARGLAGAPAGLEAPEANQRFADGDVEPHGVRGLARAWSTPRQIQVGGGVGETARPATHGAAGAPLMLSPR